MKARSVDVLHWVARLCALAIAVIAAGSCAPDDSMSASPSEKAPTAPVSEQCGAECHLTRSSWVLAASADTAAQSRPIAEGRIIGQRGGELAIVVTGDGAVLRALRDVPALVVRVNDSVRRLAWPTAGAVVLVHRFRSDEERVDVSYEIVPTSSKVPAGRFVLTQRLKGAQVISLTRRYAGWLSAGPKSLIGDAGCTGDVAIPGPGTYCGTMVTIDPYVPNGGPFGGWQSNEGTGQSGPIEITFSSPVGSVRLTAIDPNFSGNLMTAYNQAGGQLGQVEFTGNGQPGAIPPPRVTRTIAVAGIRRVVLQPAIGEYIAYEDLTVNGSAQDSLRLDCTPATVTRGDPVTCTVSQLGSRQVSRWQFRGGAYQNLLADLVASSTTWQGPLVANGTVTVFAAAPGGATDSARAVVTATARSWSSQTAQVIVEEVLQGQTTGRIVNELPARPTRLGELGHTHHEVAGVELVSSLDAGIRFADVASGPNAGLHYLTAVPWTAVPVIHINRIAMTVGSAFHNLQPVNATGGFCSQADVVPFLPIVEAHEGLAFEPSSHTRLYRDKLNAMAGSAVEDAVGTSEADLVALAEVRLEPASRAALSESARADQPPLAPVYCSFRY